MGRHGIQGQWPWSR